MFRVRKRWRSTRFLGNVYFAVSWRRVCARNVYRAVAQFETYCKTDCRTASFSGPRRSATGRLYFWICHAIRLQSLIVRCPPPAVIRRGPKIAKIAITTERGGKMVLSCTRAKHIYAQGHYVMTPFASYRTLPV